MFRLGMDSEPDKTWLPQASSVFHSRGILLEEDLSAYKLLWRRAVLTGFLDSSPSKSQLRHQQPTIYVFIHVLPPGVRNSQRRTSAYHHWSFDEDGRDPLSPEICDNLGLPNELGLQVFFHSLSFSTEHFKLIHQYQLLRGFDPTTADFARHLGCDDHIYQPVNDSDRFAEVHEEQNSSLHHKSPGASSNSTLSTGWTRTTTEWLRRGFLRAMTGSSMQLEKANLP
ncbi:hypothetical protein PM082_009254 [Marasmius tenuissimus]|nr:hypothetical protein PM082_009254 [Marasmius tenuissimus]